MIINLQIISVVLSVLVLVQTFFELKRIHTIIPIIIVFDFIMIAPTFLELIMGIPKIPYQPLAFAMNDTNTNILFCIFLIFTQICFSFEVRKLKNDDKMYVSNSLFMSKRSYTKSLKYKNLLLLFSYITPFIVIISILVAPNTSYFFNIFSVPTYITNSFLQFYDIKYMGILVYALLGSVIILKWYDNNDSIFGRFIRIFYVLLIMLAVHKRTFMMIAIGACLVVDIVKGKKLKKIIFWYTLYIIITTFYFIYYAYASGKAASNNDWYYEFNEYFFRSMHLRFAIYAVLHPNMAHILDYPGQSILFDLFYFIPRNIWLNKPWPYIYYFISGVMGYSSYQFVSWQMPTSYYPEFVSNFGILGLFISAIFTIWISRFLDRRNIACKILGTSLICLLEIYYYDDALKVVTIIVIILYFAEKRGHKKHKVVHE